MKKHSCVSSYACIYVCMHVFMCGRTRLFDIVLIFSIELLFSCYMNKGTKITFENEGDESPGVIPADIVFTLQTKPHERFERADDDLVQTVSTAMMGFFPLYVCMYVCM